MTVIVVPAAETAPVGRLALAVETIPLGAAVVRRAPPPPELLREHVHGLPKCPFRPSLTPGSTDIRRDLTSRGDAATFRDFAMHVVKDDPPAALRVTRSTQPRDSRAIHDGANA